MTLFGMFKKKLILEEKKEEYPLEKQDTDGKKELIAHLTPREHELYLILLEGYTLKESAEQLLIKYSTANTHMTSIYKKLEVKSRAELIIKYRNIN